MGNDEISMYLLDLNNPISYMLHTYTETNLNNLQGIESQFIWNSRNMSGLARDWVFDYILKHYKFMMSDSHHSPSGQVYWKKLIISGLDKSYPCGVIDIKDNNQFIELKNVNEVDSYYGADKTNYRLIIYSA